MHVYFSYPKDIGFTIASTSGTVFVEEQTGSFYSFPSKSFFNQTYSLPMAEEFVLTISDSKGDGRKSCESVVSIFSTFPHFRLLTSSMLCLRRWICCHLFRRNFDRQNSPLAGRQFPLPATRQFSFIDRWHPE